MYYRVLLVDDEMPMLRALRRELLSKPDIGHDGLEIEAYTSARQALERAGEKEGYFDVVIADYRMPEMDGVSFFKAFRQIQPDTARILLTGYIDLYGMVGAINDAQVDFVIAKPWNEYDLKGRVALAIHQRELERHNRQAAEALSGNAGGTSSLQRGAYSLFLVDDDTNMLHALDRELSMGGRATAGSHPLFSISGFTSPLEALNASVAQPPDIVVADYSMPLMNGVAFFQQLKRDCPNAVRILLSGKADMDVLMDAVNHAGVYHFLRKPWEAAELRATIAQALIYRDVLVAHNMLAKQPGQPPG